MSIEIGELIKHCRCERGVTQKELAGDYLSDRYISKIESDSTNITIDTLSFISEKLGVDLYSMYGRVNPYKSLTTFLECEKINQAIAERDPQQIEKLYNAYKDRSEYSDGMEKMVLQYAKAITTADSHKYTEAIKATEEVIGNINLNENSHISNIEIALILSHAVNLCRINKVDDGTAELLALYKMAKNNYEAEVSESEDRKTFYVNILCSCVYNTYVFSDAPIQNEIDAVLEIQKKRGTTHMISELLLCKSAYLMNNNKVQEALSTYRQAKAIGIFYYSESWFNNIAEATLNTKSKYSYFEI